MNCLNFEIKINYACLWLAAVLLSCSFWVFYNWLDSSRSAHPGQAQDVARAIVWVQKNIQKYCPQIDGSCIFLSGHSAGAHLISLVTLDHSYLKNEGWDVSTQHQNIKGVIAMSGIYSLLSPVSHRIYDLIFRWLYASTTFGFREAVLVAASPITHIEACALCTTIPPFLIFNASSDLGLQVGGRRFAAKLREHNVPCEYHLLPNTNHASIASKFEKHLGKELFLDFIQKYKTQ